MDIEYLALDAGTVRLERRQLADAGYRVADLDGALDELVADLAADGPGTHRDRARALLERCEGLPGGRAGEPEGESAVRAARPPGPRRLSATVDRDAVAGAWTGRCVGVRLGKPVETWDRAAIRAFLDATGQSPREGYLRADVAGAGSAADAAGVDRDATGGWDDRVEGMPRDDDLDFAVAALETLSRVGVGFGPEDVARTWVENLPAGAVHTAERVAYRNVLCGLDPPTTARRHNPYRELIGGQIRADVYGYVAPGRPELAASMAARDARLSHVRNGVYGARWVAATLAAVPAPSVDGPRSAVEVGLTEVPAESRLADAVGEVLAWRASGVDYGTAIDRIHGEWDDADFYEGYHVLPNAMVVAAVLAWAGPDPDLGTAVGRAVEAGFDTDCNAGTVGSVVGLARGASGLPDRWLGPVSGRLRTALAGRPRPTRSGLVEGTLALAGTVDDVDPRPGDGSEDGDGGEERDGAENGDGPGADADEA